MKVLLLLALLIAIGCAENSSIPTEPIEELPITEAPAPRQMIDIDPPHIMSATVNDGAADVRITDAFLFDFNHEVMGTIVLADAKGADLRWTGIVCGRQAFLLPTGEPLQHETIYQIWIHVKDKRGNELNATINFKTVPVGQEVKDIFNNIAR